MGEAEGVTNAHTEVAGMAIAELVCEWCKGPLGEVVTHQVTYQSILDDSREGEQVFCSWECCDASNDHEQELT